MVSVVKKCKMLATARPAFVSGLWLPNSHSNLISDTT